MAKTTNMSATKDRYFYLWQVYVYQYWQAFSITAYIFSKQGGVTSSTALTKPWFVVCLFTSDSEHPPDQLNMTRANTHNRERSENQCLVTRGDTRDTHYGQQDTVLCIMDRVPGTSGIPREKRMRRNWSWSPTESAMSWMSISANQRPHNRVV